MPHVIEAKDGKIHTIFDERDILSLADEYIGLEYRHALEDWIAEQREEFSEALEIAKEQEEENDRLRDHMRLVISDLYEEASWLRKLVAEPHPKRSDMSDCIRKIWDVLYREI